MKYILTIICLLFTLEIKAFTLNQMIKSLTKPQRKESSRSMETNENVSKDGNHGISNFGQAKKLMKKDARFFVTTLYCGCTIENRNHVNMQSCGYTPPLNKKGEVSSRAGKIEFEHVAAAESWGQSFKEWREPKELCGVKFTGRKCAETNAEFSRMESDLHNLWAEDGLTNLLRSNKTHQMLTDSDYNFGKCDIKLTSSGFMARPEARGIIARTLKYMDLSYPGRGVISDKNKKLYDAWDNMYPATKIECLHHQAAREIQGNSNQFSVEACKKAGLDY